MCNYDPNPPHYLDCESSNTRRPLSWSMRGPVYTRRSLGIARARVPAYRGSHGDDPERRYENWELRVARVDRDCGAWRKNRPISIGSL